MVGLLLLRYMVGCGGGTVDMSSSKQIRELSVLDPLSRAANQAIAEPCS